MTASGILPFNITGRFEPDATTSMENALSALPSEFVALTVKEYVPEVVAVPDKRPKELSATPGGNDPDTTEYVIGVLPLT
jgi:hypothetical protein